MTLRTTILTNVVDTVLNNLTSVNILPSSRHRTFLQKETILSANRDCKFGRPGTATAVLTSTQVKPLNLDLSTQYDRSQGLLVKKGDAKARISQSITRKQLDDTNYFTVATEFKVDLDIDSIIWTSGDTVKVTLSGSPDLSEIVVGDLFKISDNLNATNTGVFVIITSNNTLKTIDMTIAARTDATDDEATGSAAIGVLYRKEVSYTFDNTEGIVDEPTGFFWTIFLQRLDQ